MIRYSFFRQSPICVSGSHLRLFGVAGLLALSSIAMAPHSLAANAGRTTAVIQDARGTPPGQTTRVLRPKLDVFENERIQTDKRGVTQILFVDGTNLTVGPNSDLTIDRFVYKPETSAGEIAAKMGRGVLRFVGGRISKRGKVAISTPVAVIGVRGGIAVIEHDEDSGTRAVFLFGEEMTVTRLGPDGQPTESKSVTRPGFSVSVSNEGGISDAFRTGSEQLNAMLGSLEAKPEQQTAKGASATPAGQTKSRRKAATPRERSGEQGGTTGSEQPTRNAVTTAASTYAEDSEQGQDETVVPVPANAGGTEEQEENGQPIPDAVQEVVENQEAGGPSPPALWVYDATSFSLNYVLPAMFSDGSRIHPLTVIKREGDDIVGWYRSIRIRSRFNGSGSQQQAFASVSLGGFVYYQGEVRFQGPTVGSARGPSIDVGTPTSSDMYLVWSYFHEDRDQHPSPVIDESRPPPTVHTGGLVFEGSPLPIYVQAHDDVRDSQEFEVEWTLREPILPVTQYGPRGDRNWRGYATALFERHDGGATALYSLANKNRSPNDVAFFTSAEYSGIYVIFDLGPPDPDGPGPQTPTAGPDGVDRVQIYFGRGTNQLALAQQLLPDVNHISGSRGTYLSDDVFAAISSVGQVVNEDFSVVSSRRLILVNGALVPASPTSRTWMFSNDAAPADGLLPPGVQYCDCPAVKFGWWGGRINFEDGSDTNSDDVFPGTFVVGLLPDIADIPASGTASYAGHAAAAINDGTSTYAAVGGFTMEWNFATRTGEATVSNLDGRDYTASNLEAPVANPRDFHGTLTQTAGPDVGNPASGPMDGSFFSDGTNPVRDTGGQFSVESSAGYRATGSFAATQ